MNNVFTAIQNRDGEALSRMSGYEHQYTNNDNVVNMSAERLVDALFKQLKQLFPAAVVTNLKTPEQEVAAKQQWIAAFAEGGIRTREQVSAGMRHARASESPFWPSPGQFIKWCKDSKMVLGVTIDDVMAEFNRYSKEKSLYPGGPERFPWRHPVMYWVVCDIDNAIIMLDRIDTAESYDDDRIEAVKAVLRRLAGNYPVTPDGWISCSERTPNDAQWCVVNTKYGYYVQCWSEGQGWLGDDISIPECDVINWMPLPEPPQEMK
ncbi:replication protein P [Escherichia coli]|uniref:replication protein P n=1 Tax=Escherichia coli TaxID=562 RepID=UPI000DA587B5|nr:replication protein P [Escherichia coli]SQL06398.1 putative phage replication protein [Escherichia coli]